MWWNQVIIMRMVIKGGESHVCPTFPIKKMPPNHRQGEFLFIDVFQSNKENRNGTVIHNELMGQVREHQWTKHHQKEEKH